MEEWWQWTEEAIGVAPMVILVSHRSTSEQVDNFSKISSGSLWRNELALRNIEENVDRFVIVYECRNTFDEILPNQNIWHTVIMNHENFSPDT